MILTPRYDYTADRETLLPSYRSTAEIGAQIPIVSGTVTKPIQGKTLIDIITMVIAVLQRPYLSPNIPKEPTSGQIRRERRESGGATATKISALGSTRKNFTYA